MIEGDEREKKEILKKEMGFIILFLQCFSRREKRMEKMFSFLKCKLRRFSETSVCKFDHERTRTCNRQIRRLRGHSNNT